MLIPMNYGKLLSIESKLLDRSESLDLIHPHLPYNEADLIYQSEQAFKREYTLCRIEQPLV